MVKWAVTRAGHELSTYLIENPMVDAWLVGSKKPTVKQLERFARQLHLPYNYLFLKTPPVERLNFPFFRIGKRRTRSVPLNVYDAVRIVRKRQEWLSAYLAREGFDPLDLVGKCRFTSPVAEMVKDIRKALHLSDSWTGEHYSCQQAINYLALQIEEAGIVLNFSGIVGNNTRRSIPVGQCRGFVLADAYAPFRFMTVSTDRQIWSKRS